MRINPSDFALKKFKSATVKSQRDNYTSYIYILALTTAIPLISSALFNYLVDPYDVFNTPNYLNINHQKIKKLDNGRLFKAADIIRLDDVNTVILGSSIALQGLDPNHPALQDLQPAYNLALTGPNMYEVRRYLEHAIANQQNLKTVILGVDFFMFHEGLENQPGFLDERLDKNHLITSDLLNILFSFKALEDSKDTVINSLNNPDLKDNYGEDGFFPSRLVREDKVPERFEHTIDLYLTNYGDYHLSASYMNDLKRIIELCKEHQINLIVYMSPSHGTQWESTRVSGHWSTFENWKREVVKLTDVWDFSDYNSITTQKIEPNMSNYSDSNHFKKNVGDLVLNRIFGYQLEAVPKDFGALLTEANLEEHLARIRAEREIWARANPDEVELVEKIQARIRGER